MIIKKRRINKWFKLKRVEIKNDFSKCMSCSYLSKVCDRILVFYSGHYSTLSELCIELRTSVSQIKYNFYYSGADMTAELKKNKK